MKKRFLVRLDDACPTMHEENWTKIERILDIYSIKPIVAVIPENKDIKQHYFDEIPFFWERVKKWEKKGWEIAQHGYQHLYTTKDGGLIPLNQQSEFAGLSLDEQKEKIRLGYNILTKNNIYPRVWVAPSHSFDKNTLNAIKSETEISIISDGISLYPFKYHDFIWIPQQLWGGKKKNYGIWTICLHPSTMSKKDISQFEKFCSSNKLIFGSIDEIIHQNKIRGKNFLPNILYRHLFWMKAKIAKLVK